ncbi:hypothetical protein [Micromonospora sp. WMMD712]|uniref:hypothetical protein n=1 Tax=Micromonospora sp. WMMD712 TaxID=3016096 RepID=UPI00249A3335|nr:hypothetical protein [Micromonospora sp. WMMD712]WFE59663.1 hypothetical protein O7633_23660 [Micromonospora sp. WMMD712]
MPVLRSDAAALDLDLGEAPLGVPSSTRTVTRANAGDCPWTAAAALTATPR